MKTRAVILFTLATAFAARCSDQTYPIVGTGQTRCYDNRNEIPPPQPGQPFYGQDAQFPGHSPSYTLSSDGLTVRDNVTGLTWQRSPDVDGNGILNRADKLTLSQAQALPAKLNASRFGGFNDWRLPTIKELYSLILFSGTDPSGPGMESGGLKPFIDTKYFKFAYGDTTNGERVIDSQYASGTRYVGQSFQGFGKLFGVNFADGRIKGYDLQMPGGRMEKTFFVQCVRGNPQYGQNDFHDNGDGTIADRATGLTWSKRDSGKGMNWEAALAWVQAKNAENYLGHSDWRLPNAKELESLVDYARSPDTSHSPAIDPLLICTQITNEARPGRLPVLLDWHHPRIVVWRRRCGVCGVRLGRWLADRNAGSWRSRARWTGSRRPAARCSAPRRSGNGRPGRARSRRTAQYRCNLPLQRRPRCRRTAERPEDG